ncbi:MAG: hypothetical protein H6733_13900 [Alphaproteobacteria bacterium]|nr:hypothetical protein [Alphaproteobacteria bacterium]
MNATSRPDVRSSITEVVFDPDRVCERVLWAALGLELALLLMDATLNYAGWIPSSALRRVFNATREDGLASWVGVTQTVLVSLVLFAHAGLSRHEDAPRARTLGWTILAAFFLYLAADDGTMFHERVGTFVDDLGAGATQVTGFPSYAWQLVFLPFFGGMGLFILYFVAREIDDLRGRLMVVGSMGLMALSVVMDFFEGLAPDHALNLYAWLGSFDLVATLGREIGNESGHAFVLHFSKATEECVEMAAMSLMLYVFLRHLMRRFPDLALHAAAPA